MDLSINCGKNIFGIPFISPKLLKKMNEDWMLLNKLIIMGYIKNN